MGIGAAYDATGSDVPALWALVAVSGLAPFPIRRADRRTVTTAPLAAVSETITPAE